MSFEWDLSKVLCSVFPQTPDFVPFQGWSNFDPRATLVLTVGDTCIRLDPQSIKQMDPAGLVPIWKVNLTSLLGEEFSGLFLREERAPSEEDVDVFTAKARGEVEVKVGRWNTTSTKLGVLCAAVCEGEGLSFILGYHVSQHTRDLLLV